MRIKSILLLIFAMVCGITFATITSLILKNPRAVPVVADTTPMVPVFAVNCDVAAGKVVPIDKIVVVHVHENEIPFGAVLSFLDISGAELKKNLNSGSILLDEYFSYDESPVEVDGFIPPGHQVVAVQIHDDSEEHDHDFQKVKSGDTVDVLLIKKNGNAKQQNQTSTILEGIVVLATKSEQVNLFSTTGVQKNIVSLLLNDEQAEIIYKSQDSGKLRLRVRNHSSREVVQTQEPTTLEEPQPVYRGSFLPIPVREPMIMQNSPTLLVAAHQEAYSHELTTVAPVQTKVSTIPSKPHRRTGYSSYFDRGTSDSPRQWVTVPSPLYQ